MTLYVKKPEEFAAMQWHLSNAKSFFGYFDSVIRRSCDIHDWGDFKYFIDTSRGHHRPPLVITFTKSKRIVELNNEDYLVANSKYELEIYTIHEFINLFMPYRDSQKNV